MNEFIESTGHRRKMYPFSTYAVYPQNIWDNNRLFLRNTFPIRGLYTQLPKILNSPHLKGLHLDPFSSALHLLLPSKTGIFHREKLQRLLMSTFFILRTKPLE